MTATAATGTVFRLATAPARWLGRYRPGLAGTIRTDGATYVGPRAALFSALVVVLIGYTLAAQFEHAFGIWYRLPDDLAYTYQPFFHLLFAESLPYMIVVAGVGTFSPALGVLLMTVFIPTDFAAAWITTESRITPQLIPLPEAVAARLISYAVLWILAVEIPLIVRSWDPMIGGRSLLRTIAMRAGGTALLTAMWAAATPWLIRPTMVWTQFAQVQGEVSMPLWLYGYIVAAGAGLLAGAAAVGGWGHGDLESAAARPAPAPERARSVRRDVVWVVVLAVLFSGFYVDVIQAALIIGTLILTLPVLSAVLPRIPAPGWLRSRSLIGRFGLAAIVTGLIGWGFITILSSSVEMDTLLAGPIIVAITAPLFRIIVEVGAQPAAPPAAPSAASTMATTATTRS